LNLREQLQAIYDRQGRLTPQLVVNAARPTSHSLHNRFEWDDSVAGEAWRRQQAHDLIQSVRVVYKRDPEGEPHTIRAFHAIRSDEVDNNGFIYEPAERVAHDPVLRDIVLRAMEREWKALRRRYGEFAEFAELVLADLGSESEG
jgi:hypothetical protein